MARRFRLLLVVAVLGGLPSASPGLAQTADSTLSMPASVPNNPASTDPLPGLPRPTDQPRSLLQEAPPAPPYACTSQPGPYFESDPRLDPPDMPPPGAFADVDVDLLKGRVLNHLSETVQVGTRPPDRVALPSAHLDWTGSPRLDLGYRLPEGFGEFTLGYRFLDTSGTGTVPGPDTTAVLHSRLEVNVADLDYASREFSIWTPWKLKWWLGLRAASVFFDSQAAEPSSAAAADSGIFETRVSNTYSGLGPLWGVEVTRRLEGSGWRLVARAEGSLLIGRLRQHFFEEALAPGSGGQPLLGETSDANPQAVPTLAEQLGLSWQPPGWQNTTLFLGYQYETWWNVGRLSTTTSRGQLDDHGVLLRAEVNF